MSRSGWQVRERPSGALYRQRVTVTGTAEVDAIDGVIPCTDPLEALLAHADSCTTCALRTDGTGALTLPRLLSLGSSSGRGATQLWPEAPVHRAEHAPLGSHPRAERSTQ